MPVTRIALIVAADEPALFFASLAQAERALEPVDVAEGIYPAAYGPGGEPHAITIDGHRVRIAPTGEPPQPEALAALLCHFLKSTGQDPGPKPDLPDLLRLCEAYLPVSRGCR